MSEQFETYPDVPPPVQLIAVCHTVGCPVAEQECVGTYYPCGDYSPPRYMGQCGSCQQPITDLRSAPAQPPEQEPVPAPTPVPVEPSTP